ncbi:MAG: hypothetical protein P8N76_18110 [Pirellulaceae bacterium]|nr:hypothetical protein [Pirellulaceae bacterium]
MNTQRTKPEAETSRAPVYGDLLKVSAYDRVSSMLVALLLMVGALVVVLFIIWLTTRVFYLPSAPEVFLVEEEPGTQNPEGTARDINEPGIEELTDLIEPDITETLAAVTDAVSSVAASLDAVDGVMATRGKGAGDNRKRGGGDIIPRWQRWEIRFQSTTLDAYAKQLEFFKIELGALGGGRAGVDYAQFDRGGLKKRSVAGDAKDERLYFIWRGGRLKQQDITLLQQAGVTTAGRVVCQFYPKDIENQLAVLEKQQMGSRALRDVKRTVFGVRPAGRGFEFYVIEIDYRA